MSRAALLVCPGAAFPERQVPFGFAGWQGNGAGAGGARRRGYRRSDYARRAPICDDPGAQALRACCGGEHSDLGARAVAAAKRFVAETRGRPRICLI